MGAAGWRGGKSVVMPGLAGSFRASLPDPGGGRGFRIESRKLAASLRPEGMPPNSPLPSRELRELFAEASSEKVGGAGYHNDQVSNLSNVGWSRKRQHIPNQRDADEDDDDHRN